AIQIGNSSTPLSIATTLDMTHLSGNPASLSFGESVPMGGIALTGNIGDAAPFSGITVSPSEGNTVTMTGGVGSPVIYGASGPVTITASGGGIVTLGGNISTESGAVDIFGPVVLASNLAIDTTVFASGNGAHVEFHDTVDGNSAGSQALTVNAGGQTIAFDDTVGVGTALGAIALTSQNGIDLAGNVVTKGAAVAFNGNVVLANSLTIDTTGNTADINGADVTFNGTVNGVVDTNPDFTVNAGAGNIAIRGDWGGGVPLGTVTLTADTVALGANITTAGTAISGSVNINGNILLLAGGNNVGPIGGDPVIDTTAGGNIGANIVIAGNGGPGKSIGHIDDLITGSDALMLNAGAGTVDLEAEIGQTAPIGNLMIAAQTIQLGGGATDGLTINTFGAGVTGAVTMQGAVVLEGAVSINTATAGSAGGNIQFGTTDGFASIDDDVSVAGGAPLTLNAGNGNVQMYANIGQQRDFGGVTITGNDFVRIAGNVTTANNDVTLNSTGQIELGANDNAIVIGTQGGAFTANGPAKLYADVTIDTITDSKLGNGGNVTFNRTLDDSKEFTHTLAIQAGMTTEGDPGSNGGDVTFAGRVGQNLSFVGTDLAEIDIGSANNVLMTQTLDVNGDGFAVGKLTIAGASKTPGAASVIASSFIDTSHDDGAGGDVTIRTTGDVTVASFIRTAGGVDGEGDGQNGGKVTIVAGGSVTVDNCCNLNGGSDPGDIYGVATAGPYMLPLDLGGLGIYTGGYDPSVEGDSSRTAGNGGDIFIKAGGNIDLPFGAVTLGGNTVFSGGKGSNIKLIATGAVTIGNPQFGNVVGLVTNGGNSTAGNGGNAGNVTVVGDTISVTRISAIGGGTFATDGIIPSGGGDIALHATTSNSGAAVTLYGGSDDPATSTPVTATLISSGGMVGATDTAGGVLPYILTGGVIAGTAGNITIGGAYDAALADGAYIEIARSKASWFNGGSTVFVVADGGIGEGNVPLGGAVLFNGAVEGRHADSDSLRFDAVNGSVEVTGTIGGSTRLQNLVLGCCGATPADGSAPANATPYMPGSNGGVMTFDDSVTADNVIEQRLFANPTLTTTAAIFKGTVTATNLESAEDQNND